jgi:hypothetical protein
MMSPLLRSGIRVLDAGCGTGAVLLALHEAIVARGFVPGPLHGFDLTPGGAFSFAALSFGRSAVSFAIRFLTCPENGPFFGPLAHRRYILSKAKNCPTIGGHLPEPRKASPVEAKIDPADE